MDSFADAPKSIGELRAARSGDAKDISTREVLIQLLRDIDSGKMPEPDFMVITMARRTDNGILATEWVGGIQNSLEVYGLLMRSAVRLMDDTRN
jgi:hypothetical protein